MQFDMFERAYKRYILYRTTYFRKHWQGLSACWTHGCLRWTRLRVILMFITQRMISLVWCMRIYVSTESLR